jgi:hypothetical protein
MLLVQTSHLLMFFPEQRQQEQHQQEHQQSGVLAEQRKQLLRQGLQQYPVQQPAAGEPSYGTSA